MYLFSFLDVTKVEHVNLERNNHLVVACICREHAVLVGLGFIYCLVPYHTMIARYHADVHSMREIPENDTILSYNILIISEKLRKTLGSKGMELGNITIATHMRVSTNHEWQLLSQIMSFKLCVFIFGLATKTILYYFITKLKSTVHVSFFIVHISKDAVYFSICY